MTCSRLGCGKAHASCFCCWVPDCEGGTPKEQTLEDAFTQEPQASIIGEALKNIGKIAQIDEVKLGPSPASNPKTLMGSKKVPLLSVMPLAALVHMADAMRFGAFEAPRIDGTKGYGRYNWRDQPIEATVYIDAAVRHLLQWMDGEDAAADSKAHHLGHAMATIGILLDAIENNTVIDDRPKVRSAVVTKLLDKMKKS